MSISTSISLDAAPFMSALKQVQSAVSNPSMISGPMQSQMSATKKVMIGAAAAIALAAREMFATFTQVADLQKLGRTSGIAVGELFKLQLAFKSVGMQAESVPSVVGSMQSAIKGAATGTGDAAEAFSELGLNFTDLLSKSPTAQFQAIASALAAIKDPVAQAGVGMKIFGQDVMGVIDAFSAGGQLDQIGKSFGTQAKLIQENAGVFSAIQRIFSNGLSILETARAQIRSFFTGVASEVLPALMPAIKAFDEFSKASAGFDAASIGAQVGAVISSAIQAVQDGKIGELLLLSLKAAFAESVAFINGLLATETAQSLIATASGFANQMVLGLQQAWAFFTDLFSSPETTGGIGETLTLTLRSVIGIFKTELFEAFREIAAKFQDLPLVGGKIKAALAELSDSFGAKAANNAAALKDSISKSAEGLKSGLSSAISASLSKIQELSAAMFTPDPKAKSELDAMIAGLQEKVKATQEAARKENPAAAGKSQGLPLPQGGLQKAFSVEAIQTSLGRVGGGINRGGNITVMPMVDQQKETNKILIESKSAINGVRDDLRKANNNAGRYR